MSSMLVSLLALAAPPVAPVVELSVAVFPLEPKHGVPVGAADLLTENLLAQLRRTRAFARVVSPNDIAVLMPPAQQKFLMRCASDECALVDNEIAGALGVTHILVGNLGKLGNSYLLNLRLLDVRSSVLVASLSDRAPGTSDEALLDMVAPALQDLLTQARLLPSTTAPPAETKGMSPVRIGMLVGGGVAVAVAGLVFVVGLGFAALAGAIALYDFSSGWRPGEPHVLTATQGLLANGVLAIALIGGALGVGGALAGAALLALSGVLP